MSNNKILSYSDWTKLEEAIEDIGYKYPITGYTRHVEEQYGIKILNYRTQRIEITDTQKYLLYLLKYG